MGLLDFLLLCALEMTRARSIILWLILLSCNPQSASEIKEVPEVLPSQTLFEEVRIDPKRCSYQDCICTVRILPYRPQYVEKTRRSWTSVFFQESEYDLADGYKSRINDFMSTRMNADAVLVIGYTDGCGSYNYNTVLSKNRALVVSRFIRSLGFRNKIVTAGMSEITSTHSDLAKRTDVVASFDLRMEVPPPNLVADHYLLDASGSVQDYSFWVNIIAANKKPASKLHLSYTLACSDGTNANAVSPAGPTEIWWSYWQVLDKMRPGQTLLILSDFNSRYSLTAAESRAFMEKVQQKGVRVHAIRL